VKVRSLGKVRCHQPHNERKFAGSEVFVCCIILPIQGKASRLIRSAGRLRQQSMQKRFSVFHAPSQNQQVGNSALAKAR